MDKKPAASAAKKRGSFHDRIAFGICLIAFILWVNLLTYKYAYFGYYDWDLALFAHTMWNLAHGSTFVSLMGCNFLANHTNYIAFLLIPIYAVFPHPMTLVTLKICSYLSGAFVFYLIAKRYIGNNWAIIFMVLYIIFPPNIFAMLFEFDFETLAILPIFLLFYFMLRDKVIPFLITAFLMALIKENMPLVVITFGIYGLFAQKNNKFLWGIIPIVMGACIFYLDLSVTIPYLRKDFPSAVPYVGQYSRFGTTWLEIVKTILLQPVKTFSMIMYHKNLIFLKQLFGPLLSVSIFSPQVLFLGAPLFLQTLLSQAPGPHTIYFHYSATIVPFIFLASMFSLRIIFNKFKPFFSLVSFLFLIPLVLHSLSYVKDYKERAEDWKDRLDPARWEIIKNLPQEAGIVATFRFLPELSRRKSLYSFHNVWMGYNQVTGESFILPPDVQYAVVDFSDSWLINAVSSDPSAISRIKEFLLSNWKVKKAFEDIVLFEKEERGGTDLIAHSTQPFPSEEKKNIVTNLSIDQKFSLKAVDIGEEPFEKSHLISFRFYWDCGQNVEHNYGMALILKKNGQWLGFRKRNIGYSLYPTAGWQKGDYFKEYYTMIVPPLPDGDYTLEVAFIDTSINDIAKLTHSNPASINKEDMSFVLKELSISQNSIK